MSALLKVENLHVTFRQAEAETHAVKGVSFQVAKGETVALVGESGSGKSVTALSSVGLLPSSADVTGSTLYDGAQMIGASEAELRRVRGNDISLIACPATRPALASSTCSTKSASATPKAAFLATPTNFQAANASG